MGLGNMRKPAAYTKMCTVLSCRVNKDKSTRKLRGVPVFVHDQYLFILFIMKIIHKVRKTFTHEQHAIKCY